MPHERAVWKCCSQGCVLHVGLRLAFVLHIPLNSKWLALGPLAAAFRSTDTVRISVALARN